jgi:thioredoxin 1
MIAFGAFLFEPMRKHERNFVKKSLLIVLLGCWLPFMAGCKWFGCSCQCGSHSPAEVPGKADSSVIAITSVADFDVRMRDEKKPMVVDFSAPAWCGACKVMKPIFDTVAGELKDIVFATVDVDAVPDLAQRYGISGVPAFIFIKDGKIVGSPVVGAMDKETFKKTIENKFKS